MAGATTTQTTAPRAETARASESAASADLPCDELLRHQQHCGQTGSHAFARGDYAIATDLWRAALESAQALGRRDLLSRSFAQLALALQRIGQHEQALEIYARATTSCLSNGGDAEDELAGLTTAHALCWLGVARLLCADKDSAARRSALHRARALAEDACVRSGARTQPEQLADSLDALVAVLAEEGEPAAARHWIDRVQGQLPATVEAGSLLRASLTLTAARVAVLLDHEPVAGLQRLAEFDAIAGQPGGREEWRGDSLRLRTLAYEQLGEWEQALRWHCRWSQHEADCAAVAVRECGRLTRLMVDHLRAEAVEFVSHDLRDQLVSVSAQLAALRPRVGARLLDEACGAAERAVGAANQFLDLVRANRLHRGHLRTVDLGELVDDVCEEIPLPPGAHLLRDIQLGALVRGDRPLLMRAIRALLCAALERSDQARVLVELRRRPEQPAAGGSIVLSIMQLRLPVHAVAGASCFDGEKEGVGAATVSRLALAARVTRLHAARVLIGTAAGAQPTVSLVFKEASVAALH